MQEKKRIKVISVYPVPLQSIQGYKDDDIEVVFVQELNKVVLEASTQGKPLPAQWDKKKIFQKNLEFARNLQQTGEQIRCTSVQDEYIPIAFLINELLGLPGPHFLASVHLKNKFLARKLLNIKNFWFEEVDVNKSLQVLKVQANSIQYPAYMKPTLDCGSRGQGRVQNSQQFLEQVNHWKSNEYTHDTLKFFQHILGEACPHFPQYMVEQCIDLEKVDQLNLEVEIGNDQAKGFQVISFLNQKRYKKGSFSAFTVETEIGWSVQQLMKAKNWVETVLNKFLQEPLFNFINHVLNVEIWRLPDGSFQITEVNSRASYAINMLVSSAFNSNFSVSCHRVIAGLPRRPIQNFFQRLLQLKKESKKLEKSSMCVYVHYKGTGKMKDVFDFQQIESELKAIRDNGEKNTCTYNEIQGEYYTFKQYKASDLLLTENYEAHAGHELIFQSMVMPETNGENSVMKKWHSHFDRIIRKNY